MEASTPLDTRRSAARGLNILAAAGIVLVLAAAGTAIALTERQSASAESVVAPTE